MILATEDVLVDEVTGTYGGPGTTFTVRVADVHSAQWSMCTVHRVDVHGSPVRCLPCTVHRG